MPVLACSGSETQEGSWARPDLPSQEAGGSGSEVWIQVCDKCLCRDAAAGGRPASLAALLLGAPQCVPFDQRVLIFRSLVAADKERRVSTVNTCLYYLPSRQCVRITWGGR